MGRSKPPADWGVTGSCLGPQRPDSGSHQAPRVQNSELLRVTASCNSKGQAVDCEHIRSSWSLRGREPQQSSGGGRMDRISQLLGRSARFPETWSRNPICKVTHADSACPALTGNESPVCSGSRPTDDLKRQRPGAGGGLLSPERGKEGDPLGDSEKMPTSASLCASSHGFHSPGPHRGPRPPQRTPRPSWVPPPPFSEQSPGEVRPDLGQPGQDT